MSIGLKPIGPPKTMGSLMLKIDGTITALPVACNLDDRAKSMRMAKGKVVPIPPTAVCVNFFSVVLFYQYFQHSIFVHFFWLPRLRLLTCLLHKVRKARTLCNRQVNLKT